MGYKTEVGSWRNMVLYHAMLSPSWSFPRTTNFEMQSVQQGNPGAGYWQWTWIPRLGLMKGRRRDASSRCIPIVRLITRSCCTWHTTQREIMLHVVKCGMTDGRGSISRANRFPCGENFAGLPGMSANWGTRASIAPGLPRKPADRCGRMERLHYNFVYNRGMFARGF